MNDDVVEAIAAMGAQLLGVYCFLERRANTRGKVECSYGRLADDLNISRRHVITCIQKLEDAGYVQIRVAPDAARTHTANTFTLPYHEASEQASAPVAHPSERPSEQAGEQPSAPRAPKVDTSNYQVNTSNSLSDQEKSSLRDSFNMFFDAYPPERRLRVDEAKREWKKIHPNQTQLNDMLASLDRWRRSENWLEGFAPGIEKFLATRMWEGRPPGAPPLGTGGLL